MATLIVVGMPKVKEGTEIVGLQVVGTVPVKRRHVTGPTQTKPGDTVSYTDTVAGAPMFWIAIAYNTGAPSPIPVEVN